MPPLAQGPHLQVCVDYSNAADWVRERRRESSCIAAIRYLSLGSPPPPPSHLHTAFADDQELPPASIFLVYGLSLPKPACKLRTMVSLFWCARCTLYPLEIRAMPPVSRMTGLLVPTCPWAYMRPCVLRAYVHDDASVHLGVHRTLRLHSSTLLLVD